MFGISASEFIVLVAVAAVVLGPERLPQYAQQLGRLVRELRRMAQGASQQVRSEMGPEFDDIDWTKLDPRQYDPRRIVREALSDSFDPDDPLGLKELRDDVKAQSPGGPREWLRDDDEGDDDRRAPATNGAASGTGPNATNGHVPADPPDRPPLGSSPRFDPDAT